MRLRASPGRALAMVCALQATPCLGQSVRIDAPKDEEPSASGPAPVDPEATLPIIPPTLRDASVTYPEGATGDAIVLLELVVLANGRVESAVAVDGTTPFSRAAEQAALAWSFFPARRGDRRVAAKIRFQVHFVEPNPPPSEPTAATETVGLAADEETADLPRVEATPIEVAVIGQRDGPRRALSQAEIKELPGAFGDPFRAIETLPGVVPLASGLPYFFVRGAPPSNVGYLFDGIPVPALYHFAAGPGVLHPTFVERVDLFAGAYPARYGRYTGGLAAGSLAPPSYHWRGQASVRLVDSGGMVEAPFAEGRGSAMLGGRYSYTGALLSLLDENQTIDYWDYQGRLRYALDDDDSLELLGFGSADYLQEVVDTRTEEKRTPMDIDFHRIDLRWQRQFERGSYRQALMLGLDNTYFDNGDIHFENQLLGLRSDLKQQLSSSVGLRAGVDLLVERLRQHLNKPISELGTENEVYVIDENGNEVLVEPDESPGSDLGLGFDRRRQDVALGAHLDLVIDAAEGVEVIPGLRSDLFVSGKRQAWGIDPRISASFLVVPGMKLLHGFGVTHQTPSFVVPLPGVKPSLAGGLQRALQHSAGMEYRLPFDVTSSLVLFQNLFFNMTDGIGLDEFNTSGDAGRPGQGRFRALGRGVGAELMLRRDLSRQLGGFLSYTLSRSERSSGRWSGPAYSDRTHVLNMALAYQLARTWRFGSRFVFYTGVPAKLDDSERARQPPRTPPFWRLDWRLEKRWPHSDHSGHWSLVLEVLNTTLNREVFNRVCQDGVCEDERFGPVTIPSIGVEAVY